MLAFDEIRKTLELGHPQPEQLREIPLDSIIGSVSRYYDFDRQFNPLMDSDKDRWARVKELVESKGLDPIEVYQVGDVFFVIDGNHRVSVARQMKSEFIQAYVKVFRTEVEVKPDDDLADLILKIEHMELMEDTKLDQVRPDVEFRVTVTGRYREIQEHISVHRYYMGLNEKRDVPIEEAAVSWVDHYYLPGVGVIRENNTMADFPGRTETDLYLWLKKHQWELEKSLERDIPDQVAASDLAKQYGRGILRKFKRAWSNLFDKE